MITITVTLDNLVSYTNLSALADLRRKIVDNYKITELLCMKLGKENLEEIRTGLITLDIFMSFGMWCE